MTAGRLETAPISKAQVVTVGVSPPYRVYIGQGLLRQAGRLLQEEGIAPDLGVIVTNPTVGRLWLDYLEQGLRDCGERSSSTGGGTDEVAGRRSGGAADGGPHPAVTIKAPAPPPPLLIPDGEQHKHLGTVSQVYDELAVRRCGRDSVIVAIGGGVVGDTAGFAAATYMRGIRIVQVPTTLLAQVDSSVGGKTGVDHRLGKNLIGAIHHPALVLCDLDTLSTLPPAVYLDGLAEVAKTALISGEEMLHSIERDAGRLGRGDDVAAIEDAVLRCVEVKAAVVQRDERDTGDRMVLNLGHTFGHAIEAACGYRGVSHGRAVAVGLGMAARLAVLTGIGNEHMAARTARLVSSLGLPISLGELGVQLDPAEIVAYLTADKKRVGGHQRYVLARSPGDVVVVDDLPLDLATQAVQDCVRRRDAL